MSEPCDACGEGVADALARTVRLSVDRTEVDVQRLCPACFADWIDRYQREMEPSTTAGDSEIIVD
jgi:predicted GNAT family acetyltransferase